MLKYRSVLSSLIYMYIGLQLISSKLFFNSYEISMSVWLKEVLKKFIQFLPLFLLVKYIHLNLFTIHLDISIKMWK